MSEFLNNPWVLATLIYGMIIGIFGLIFILKYTKEKKAKK